MQKLSIAVMLLVSMLFGSVNFASAAVSTQELGAVKVHTYSSEMGENAVVVEGNNLVIFDAFGDEQENGKLKDFVDSLKKPIERVFISHSHNHHWAGIEKVFPDAEFFSIDADDIKKQPEATGLTVQKISDGKIVADDVEYEFSTYPDLGAWVIKMPAQRIAMLHHLGYVGVHVPMPPLDKRLEILNGLEKEGYSWFIGGHGAAAKAYNFNNEVASYYKVVTDAVASSKTPQDAKAVIVSKYPNWGGDVLLDTFLPLFY